MKKIELKESHFLKLSEICKKTFPKIKNIDVYEKSSKNIFLEKEYFVEWQEFKILNENKENEQIFCNHFSIHWFEFCINILPNYLISNKFKSNCKRKILNKIFKEIESGKNPIDYLHTLI